MLCANLIYRVSVLLKPTKNTQILRREKNEVRATFVTSAVESLLHIQGQLIYKGVALFDVFYLGTSTVCLFSIAVLISGLQQRNTACT